MKAFAARHPDAAAPLDSWWRVASRAEWSSLRDVRLTYPHADAVTLDCGRTVTVFNIGGNKHRLVADVVYSKRMIFIKADMTHAEYDKEKWKVRLCRD